MDARDLELLAYGLLGGKGNLGQNLGQAGLLMMQGRNEREDREQRKKQQDVAAQLQQLQLQQAQRQMAEQQKIAGVMSQYARPAQPQQTAPFQADTFPGEAQPQGLQTITQPARPAGFDFQGASSALMGMGTPTAFREGMQLAQYGQKQAPKFADINPKDFTPESVRKFEQSKVYGDLQAVPDKAGPLADLNAMMDAAGITDPAERRKYLGQALTKKTTSSPTAQVTVNTGEKSFAQDLGKAAAGAVETSFAKAQSAIGTLQNAQQIRQAIQGGAIMGPGATPQVFIEQVGQRLGVGGQSSAERLANTRALMQGLARQELAAAQGMKGQGQITESEREILRRAEAGKIDDFTPAEMNVFVNAIEKTARFNIKQHQSNLERARSRPGAGAMTGFFELPEIPEAAPTPQAAPQQNVMRFDKNGKRIQ